MSAINKKLVVRYMYRYLPVNTYLCNGTYKLSISRSLLRLDNTKSATDIGLQKRLRVSCVFPT